MSHQPTNLDPDLLALQNEGLSIEVSNGFLLVHDVPYLTEDGNLLFGVLSVNLTLSGTKILPPSDHTAYWCGDWPCLESGDRIVSLVNSEKQVYLGNGLTTSYFLSLYPDNGMYKSNYTKVMNYYNTIAGPALHKYPDALKGVNAQLVFPEGESALNYIDTNSSKSNLNRINQLFKTQRVAIVGLGGTGSYVLDYLAKLDLKEIALYDADEFNSHNAFRAPGAPPVKTLEARMSKSEYLASIYSNMNNAIHCHVEMIGEDNIHELYDYDAVFICIDSNVSRNFITRHLADNNVTFIDSGLGLFITNDIIGGNVRVTSAFAGNYDHLKDSFGDSELNNEDNPYQTNVQIAELNSMAAVLSVIKWKQILGIYDNNDSDLNKVFNIGLLSCI
jgi:hypothetical protein